VQKKKKDYKFTHCTPFPHFKQTKNKLANHTKRKERERKKNLQKRETFDTRIWCHRTAALKGRVQANFHDH